jgi:hypothetical protein
MRALGTVPDRRTCQSSTLDLVSFVVLVSKSCRLSHTMDKVVSRAWLTSRTHFQKLTDTLLVARQLGRYCTVLFRLWV